MPLERVINFIRSKSPKYWLRLILAIIGVWVGVYVITTYTVARVSITYNDGISPSPTISSIAVNREAEKTFTVGDFAILRRDTSAINVSADIYQTNKEISPLPIIGVATISVNLYKDKDVRKYSGDSLGCNAYNQPADTLLSYRCGKPKYVVKYTQSTGERPWENTPIATMSDGGSSVYTVQPFQTGVLGVNIPIEPHPPFDILFYIDGNGARKLLNIPDDVPTEHWDTLSVVADKASSDSDRFLLVNKRGGVIYLGTYRGSSVSYQKTSLPDNYNSMFDSLICSLLENTAYCHYGKSSRDADSIEEAAYKQESKNTTLAAIDFSDTTSEPKIKQYKVSDSQPATTNLFVTRSNHLYTLSNRDLYSLNLKDDVVEFRLFTTGVRSISGGDGLVYIKDNAVFKIDDVQKESYLVFRSDHLRLSNIGVFGDNVFINAFINDMPDQKIHTYKIESQPNTRKQGERLVDKLPFYMRDKILSMDYVDNTIRIRVFASSTVDKAHGRLVYNENEYERNKEDILTELSRIGISTDQYNIVFSH